MSEDRRRWSRPAHEVDFSNWPIRSPAMSAVSERADNHSMVETPVWLATLH
jgi:hypothetical protein